MGAALPFTIYNTNMQTVRAFILDVSGSGQGPLVGSC